MIFLINYIVYLINYYVNLLEMTEWGRPMASIPTPQPAWQKVPSAVPRVQLLPTRSTGQRAGLDVMSSTRNKRGLSAIAGDW